MVSKILRKNLFGHRLIFSIRKSGVGDGRFLSTSASSTDELVLVDRPVKNVDFRHKPSTYNDYNGRFNGSSSFNSVSERQQHHWTDEQLRNVLNMLKNSQPILLHSIAILPNAVHQNRQDQLFVDQYLKDWWNAIMTNLQPLGGHLVSGQQRVKGYAAEVGRTLTNDQLSIAMNGLRKINEATNGQAFQKMTWPNVQLLFDHVLDDQRVTIAAPYNLDRTLQSILCIAKIFKDDPLCLTWRRKRATRLLSSFLDVYVQRQSRFPTSKHTRGILTKLCLLLPEDQPPTDDVMLDQLTRLCYGEMDMAVEFNLQAPAVMNKLNNFAYIFLTWSIDPSKYKPDFWPMWFKLFNQHFRHLQEQRNPAYFWHSLYQCLKIALEFDQSESFDQIAKGLWLHRIKDVWTSTNQQQVRELIRLVQNRPIKFDGRFLLVELKRLLKDSIDKVKPDMESMLFEEDSDIVKNDKNV